MNSKQEGVYKMHNHNKLKINILIASYVFVLMLFCVNSSPFINTTGTDSSVFVVMGRGMAQGKVMYKDLFDHKGLYLYFINFFAALISSRSLTGLFIIECMFMFVCAKVSYALFRMYSEEKIAFLAMQIFVFFALMPMNLEGGNFTEEYVLAFQVCSVYILLKSLRHNSEYTPVHMMLQGVMAGIALCIRPNMIMMWGAIALTAGFDLLRKKNLRGFIVNLSAGLTGFLISIAPVIIYALLNASIQDTIFGMFTYNMLYTSDNMNISAFFGRIIHALLNIRQIILLAAIVISAVIAFRKFRNVSFRKYYYVMLFMCIISVSLSGRRYGHYYEYLVPFTMPAALWLSEKIIKLNLRRYFTAVLLVMMLISSYRAELKSVIVRLTGIKTVTPAYIGWDKFIEKNRDYYSENEKVLITGTHYAKFYNLFGVIPHDRYFYIPATRYGIFTEPVDSQIDSIVSGTNDVIIVTYDSKGTVYPEAGRTDEINHALNSMYDLLHYDSKNNIAMYGRKKNR